MMKWKSYTAALLCAALLLGGCSTADPASGTDSAVSGGTTAGGGSGTGSATDGTGNPATSPTTAVVEPPAPVGPVEGITVQPLDMKSVVPVAVKKLATSSDTRRVVNTENPLFLFRTSCKADEMLTLWRMLPEDIREYSAIATGFDESKTNAQVLSNIDALLTVADREGIPVLWQIEYWNSYAEREGFTESELVSLLERHSSLIGYAHTELSCMFSDPVEIDRMKQTLRACRQKNALFVWFDMEYVQNTNVFARFLEDSELYELMSSYSRNVVLVDKHNGQGRHFAVQSAAMGMWLAGVCGNWGSNVESWLWWEEGLGQYDDMGGTFRSFSQDMIKQYPAAMFGIDTLNDAVGGATVYSFEDVIMTATDLNGDTVWTPAFYNVCYPIYQKIVAGGLIPGKEQVKSKVKVAYQYSDIDSQDTAGYEASLFVDLYGPTRDWLNRWNSMRVSKKWIPTTGRYYIVPSLPKQVDAAQVLPGATVLNTQNEPSLIGTTAAEKRAFFDSRYGEFYTGTATMYAMDGYALLFNNHENITQQAYENATFTLAAGKTMKAVLPEHTYALLYDGGSSVSLELYNYRYDARAYLNKQERYDMFIDDYLEELRNDNELDRRTLTFRIENLSAEPQVTAAGNHNAEISTAWDAASGVLTVTVTMNGVTRLQLQEIR